MSTKINHGDLVQDKITGMKGVAIGKVSYITGCNQILVQPQCEDGKHEVAPESKWFDEGRMLIVKQGFITLEDVQAERDGADKPAPNK
jgi:hypothetical protein